MSIHLRALTASSRASIGNLTMHIPRTASVRKKIRTTFAAASVAILVTTQA